VRPEEKGEAMTLTAATRFGAARLLALSLSAAMLAAAPASASLCSNTSTGLVPLVDLRTGTHQGEQGGLYPGGVNQPPALHAAIGDVMSSLVMPRDATGLPAADGRVVFMSVGMSNTFQESQHLRSGILDDETRSENLTFVNGAQGGQAAEDMADPTAPYWSYVDEQLADAGVTPLQVQTVWLKQANRRPDQAFPADAERLQGDLREIVTILKARYPNLMLVYLSSRIYAGYASTPLNPEPHAYQSGFSVKWLIEEQIGGTLPYGLMPWLGWGPYFWADGLMPRGTDGLIWTCDDFAVDGTHPSGEGASKVGDMLLDFLQSDPTATSWYLAP